MSAVVYFSLALCMMVLYTSGSVIKMQDLSLSDGVVLKLVIKEDPEHKGKAVASIKIDLDHQKPKSVRSLFNNLIPTGAIPKFEDRILITNNKCPLGQVRRGPVCV
ncbi:unnamed protein product [Danaus chrysippus]|uniref:(African queen) hypothetical protein n=1 Tax=Danaus chrysippus TaxID=151541 RepID=A0A8J2QBW6_9NEOP|nr:unnamed protein product [Danaus chrysippus]